MHLKPIFIASAVTAAFLFTGCGDNKSTTLQDNLAQNSVEKKIAGFAVFNPAEGLLPYPNSILFAPNDSSTNDFDGGKTLNIPYEPTDADANIKRQLNALTGFSTTSAITAPLSEGTQLDAKSMVSGVKMYKVNIDPATGAVTDINATLTFGVDFVATQSGDKVAIIPLKPLEGLTNYMVVLNNSLKDAQGRVLSPDYATALTLSSNPVQPGGSITPETAAKLEAIRQANRAMMGAMLKAGLDPTDTVQIWNFRTQMIGATQAYIAAAAKAHTGSQLALQDAGISTKALFDTLGIDTSMMTGSAEIYAGTLSNVPQYMPQGSPADPTPVLKGEFTYAAPFQPVVEANVTLPVVATLPSSDANCTQPANGWPVVIYQHGITRVRTDLFVYGETLAKRCYAGVAIDLPLHGITESNTSINPFYAGPLERTFNVDIVTEDPYGTVVAFKPDGVIDSTGINFMNLANVTTTRDNLQQTTSDLTVLTHAIATAVGAKLDGNRVGFLSHSLGNIAAIGFLNHTDSINAAVLMMPGQQLIPFLTQSAVFGPIINGGLEAAAGIVPGTPEYAAFMLATQTIIDDADPANYTPSIGQNSLPILEIAAIGDGTEGSGDQHIPYVVTGAPLSGGKPFISFTQATEMNVSAIVDTPLGKAYFPTTKHTATLLTEGEHRSPLSPQFGLDPFLEIHTELISFIDSNGSAIGIYDPAIIKQ